jgi:hypothetical protein
MHRTWAGKGADEMLRATESVVAISLSTKPIVELPGVDLGRRGLFCWYPASSPSRKW